jgi:hypothetical protein
VGEACEEKQKVTIEWEEQKVTMEWEEFVKKSRKSLFVENSRRSLTHSSNSLVSGDTKEWEEFAFPVTYFS